MGAWGPGLYADDFAMDLKGTIEVLARLPFPPDRLLDMLVETAPAQANNSDDDGHTIFWLVAADQFVKNMNTAAYLGQANWQLPPVDPSCAASYLCSANAPFQGLYYNQLGLTPGTPVVAAADVAVGPFTGIRPYLYWTCEANTIQEACQTTGPAPGFEWSFWFGNGFEGTDVFAHDMYVTAYFPGTRPSTAGPVSRLRAGPPTG